MSTTQTNPFQDLLDSRQAQTKSDSKHFIKATLREGSRAIVEVSKSARLLAQTINVELETNLVESIRDQFADLTPTDIAILKSLI